MLGRLFIAGAILALILRAGHASADLQSELMLLPPVCPACISSPFGPRVLANHPQAGTYHYGVDLAAPAGASIVATAPFLALVYVVIVIIVDCFDFENDEARDLLKAGVL
jgi:hypothetical protein